MSPVEILLFFLKAFAIVMFAMNVGVILTWADRRQGAAIQDRVGPNRAVAWLPTRVAQGLLVVPAVGAAAAVLGLVATQKLEGESRVAAALIVSELAVFALWLTGLVIAGRVARRGVRNSLDAFLASVGDPRRFFYLGLLAHVLVLAIGLRFEGTESFEHVVDAGLYSGAALLAGAFLAGAFYAAYSIRNEPRVGLRLFGLLHPAADGLKTLFKEDFIPPSADRFLHSIAPLISFFPALVVLAVVPFGDTLCFGSDADGAPLLSQLFQTVPADAVCPAGASSVRLQVADLDVGVLYFFALAGTGVVGAALAGWASNNKFSLLGGVRAASQMVSYEVTMGLTLIGILMIYGTLRVDQMILWQKENTWGIFVQPLAAVMFFAAAVAETKRIPFDMPEGESEIVAGYYTEYAGMKFAMFFFSEYIGVVTSSALIAALFFGGWHMPFLERDGLRVLVGETLFFEQALPHGLVVVLGVLGFIGKVLLLCWLQLTIRWTLPRFRYDQLMRLGWRQLLPASIANILVTGLVVLLIAGASAKVQNGLSLLADLTQVLIALVGVFAVVRFVVFLLEPRKKRQLLATTSARYAAQSGGTRSARMSA